MKRLLKYIASKAKKRTTFEQSEEFQFFLDNRHYLTRLPKFSAFYEPGDEPFNVIRANVVLYSYINKMTMEAEIINLKSYISGNSKSNRANFVKSYHEIISEQPYYQEGKNKIYIPFFSRSLNQIYFDEPEKILTSPYSELKDKFQDTVMDPFDTYGSEIYNSHFSRLVKVLTVDKETAFFHYDTNTIYLVNEQGRLDGTVVLFDKYLRHPNYSHMLERIKPVVEAYFNFNREEFIKALYNNGFISLHLIHLIQFHDWAKL